MFRLCNNVLCKQQKELESTAETADKHSSSRVTQRRFIRVMRFLDGHCARRVESRYISKCLLQSACEHAFVTRERLILESVVQEMRSKTSRVT